MLSVGHIMLIWGKGLSNNLSLLQKLLKSPEKLIYFKNTYRLIE